MKLTEWIEKNGCNACKQRLKMTGYASCMECREKWMIEVNKSKIIKNEATMIDYLCNFYQRKLDDVIQKCKEEKDEEKKETIFKEVMKTAWDFANAFSNSHPEIRSHPREYYYRTVCGFENNGRG